VRKINNFLMEFSGGLGDLPTFLVFLIPLAVYNNINPAPTLVLSGIFNIINGLVFKLPIPIEPMKAIAAISIKNGYDYNVIYLSGIIIGIIFFILSFKGIIDKITKFTPQPVVKGVQIALGIVFIELGLKLINKNSFSGLNYIIILILILAIIISKKREFPIAFTLISLGFVYTLLVNDIKFSINIYRPEIINFNYSADLIKKSFILSLIQLSLSISNSIIATYFLLKDYFPENEINPKRITYSLFSMNTISCFFGSIPLCHGAGGISAQYNFGARTGKSIIILGFLKLFFGLFLSEYIISIFNKFPPFILSSMLIYSGLKLILKSYSKVPKIDKASAIITALSSYFFNMFIGFIIGLLIFLFKEKLYDYNRKSP